MWNLPAVSHVAEAQVIAVPGPAIIGMTLAPGGEGPRQGQPGRGHMG